jgi:hypothetical protein
LLKEFQKCKANQVGILKDGKMKYDIIVSNYKQKDILGKMGLNKLIDKNFICKFMKKLS